MRTLVLIMTFISASAQADITVKNCFKGLKQAEQNQNMAICESQISQNQVCSDNMFEHGNAAYDVCVLELIKPTLVSCVKGFSPHEQSQNLAQCKQNRDNGTVCVANLWTHKQGAYDICLMK